MHTDDFTLDLRRSLAPYNHLGVTSGWTVVQPSMPTVCGVGDCFSPPIAARGFQLRLVFEADGRRIVDDGNTGKGDCGLLYAGGTWRPDGLVRTGTYHHRPEGGRLLSFAAASRLTPLFGRAGFVLQVTLRNRSGRALRLRAVPQIDAGAPKFHPLDAWDYGVPPPGAAARAAGADAWTNEAIAVHLVRGALDLELGPDREGDVALAVVFTEAGAPPPAAPDPGAWAQATSAAWQGRLDKAARRMPTLDSDIPGLAEYYRRSVISGLVCFWDRPDFVTRPFVATSGMDGGAICTYPWDTAGYVPHALNLTLGEGVDGLLQTMMAFGLDRHSRFAPAGNGRDVPYAYNTWSFVNLVWTTACHRGPTLAAFRAARDTFLAIESRLTPRGDLVDWGRQHNLLEMRQAGWEHVVASPNAERAWCLVRLADLADRLGEPGGAAWRRQAEAIRAAVRRELWDEQAGWFRCLYPDGAAELVYSIQAFDALRAGACTPAMAQALIAHVRDGAFLGEYGVSSVSAEDARHYELNDPDWSGGGAYSGDGPLLALTLWEHGDAARAWDVLRRHFWMGRHLPYFPQEHYCDRPAVPAHKRANIVSGIAGAEAILFGMLGITLGLDGAIRVAPMPPPGGEVAVRGLRLRDRRVDVAVSPGHCRVDLDGRCLHDGAPCAVVAE